MKNLFYFKVYQLNRNKHQILHEWFMNLVCGGLQISNIPKLSFSWAQGATKNRSIHHSAPVLYFPTTKMMIWLPWTHGFSQCMKNIFLHWRNALCLRWDIHVKLSYYVPLNPCENQHNILLHLPPYKFVWMMVVCFYSFLMMMHIRLLFH